MVKVDANGNKQWDKTYGGLNNDNLQALAKTPDNGFLIGGTSPSPAGNDKSDTPKGSADFWILKINSSGTKQWDKTIGGESYDHLHTLVALEDNTYVLSGTSTSSSGYDKNSSSLGEMDYWLVALEPGGSNNPDPDLEPEPEKLIESFTLLNAATDTDLQNFADNAVINVASLTAPNLDIRANTSTDAISVTFRLSGTQSLERFEANAPYIVFGATGTDYHNWVHTPGNYTLEATPSVNGRAGTPLVINFRIINEGNENQIPVAEAGACRHLMSI